MLMDIRKGRRTEIGYMNGYLTTLGRRYNVPMPTTSMLTKMVDLRTRIPIRL
jgi:2-dehydropantoate 2-reductase